MLIPYPDVIAAALQTQTAHLAPVRRSHVGNDSTHHNVLNGLAVRTRHSRNLLTKESASFVYIGLVAAVLTTIFQFPSHIQTYTLASVFALQRYEKNTFLPWNLKNYWIFIFSSRFFFVPLKRLK
jgi:hypothetical protein